MLPPTQIISQYSLSVWAERRSRVRHYAGTDKRLTLEDCASSSHQRRRRPGMADHDNMDDVDSGTEVDPTDSQPTQLGSLAGQSATFQQFLQQHPSLRKTFSDPSSNWKGSQSRDLLHTSPLQVKKTVGRRHSKGEQGGGSMEVTAEGSTLASNPDAMDSTEDTSSEVRQPQLLSRTQSGSSTSSITASMGGLNFISPQSLGAASGMPVMMPLGLGMFPGMANPVVGGAGAVGGATEQMQELMKKQLELMSQMQQQSGQTPQMPLLFPQMAPSPALGNTLGGIFLPQAQGFPLSGLGGTPLPTLAGGNPLGGTALPSMGGNLLGNSSLSSQPVASAASPSTSSGQSGDAMGVKMPLTQSLSQPMNATINTQGMDKVIQDYQLAQQKLVGQQQQIYQNFLEQQQRLLQHQFTEKKHFEEQLRQLSQLHLQAQNQLENQQRLLQQMHAEQLKQVQKQQQELLLQQMDLQRRQQYFSSLQTQLQLPGTNKQRLKRVNQSEIVRPHTAATNSFGSKPEIVPGAGVTVASSVASPQTTSEEGPLSSNPLIRTPSQSSGASGLRLHPQLAGRLSQTSIGSTSSVGTSVSGSIGGDRLVAGGGVGATGLIYDTIMLKHACNCGGPHPEHPGRLQSIWSRLYERKVVEKCQRLRARKAQPQELLAVHSQHHVQMYGRSSSRKTATEKRAAETPSGMYKKLQCGGIGIDADTYWNDVTSQAAKMAAGCVIQLAEDVAAGTVKNGFALVRPPGHHAMHNQAMGFCYFNNVALAAKALLNKPNVNKVMIVDWDIHHGSGTQQVFYDNPAVLVVSIHRFDDSQFFPGTGRPEEIGNGAGTGYNVNIAFSGQRIQNGSHFPSCCGDTEYLAAFRSVVLPLALDFQPDIILVSAGFNATEGHPPTLGGYNVSPECYAHLTRLLMTVCNGKVVMALEGGYELRSLCASAEACMMALLGDDIPALEETALKNTPNPAAVESIQKTVACLLPTWKRLHVSKNLIPVSHFQAHCGMKDMEALAALSSLSVQDDTRSQGNVSSSTIV